MFRFLLYAYISLGRFRNFRLLEEVLGLTCFGSLLPHCGRRVGDEGKLTRLIAVGGRAEDRFEGKDLSASAIKSAY
jgi:hypothetical protein